MMRDDRIPVRMAHLGLGAFFRAHQAWYTEQANRAHPEDRWGIHAVTGRTPASATVLEAQGCRYTLFERGPGGDRETVVTSVVAAGDGADRIGWRTLLSSPDVAVLTVTVTEAGYLLDRTGRPDVERVEFVADRRILAERMLDAPGPTTAPGRIVDGLHARWSTSAQPLAIVSCDNLSRNGERLRSVVLALASVLEPEFGHWVATEVAFVSTVVDRITPALTAEDRASLPRSTTDWDAVPVVCEPFSEWILAGRFPLGRPEWEAGGARFVDDIEPWERRKLWLLNAGHSLLAYLGLPRGVTTIDQAMREPALVAQLERLWAEARTVLPLSADHVDESLSALRSRFSNDRIRHRLEQIAADGSQKLPLRILDVHRARRAAGLPVGEAGPLVLAAWARHLADGAGRVSDVAAGPLAARLRAGLDDATAAGAIIRALAPDLVIDDELVDAVADSISILQHSAHEGSTT